MSRLPDATKAVTFYDTLETFTFAGTNHIDVGILLEYICDRDGIAQMEFFAELIKFSEQIVNNYVVLWPLFYAGVFYLVFSGLLTLLFRYVEKKLDYYKV